MLINKAYIVPSIFFGQSRQANTNMGIVLISAKVCITRLSPIEKNLSGIPSKRFFLKKQINFFFYIYLYLVTNITWVIPVQAQMIVEHPSNFLNGISFKNLWYIKIPSILANEWISLSCPMKLE